MFFLLFIQLQLQLMIFVTNVLFCRSLFELDLMKVNPEQGFYRIVVSVSSQQPSEVKLIGTSGAEVRLDDRMAQFENLEERQIQVISLL
jgi:hypothetical protein